MTTPTALLDGFSISRRLTFAHVGAIAITSVYLLGYLIDSIFVREFGVESSHLLRGQFIETGLVFLVIVAVMVVLPFGTVWLIKNREQNKSARPIFWSWIIASLSLNYCVIVVFFSLFITKYEWNGAIQLPSIFHIALPVRIAFSCYFFFVIVVLVLVSVGGRLDKGPRRRAAGFFLLSFCAVASFWFDVELISSVRWLPAATHTAMYFIASVYVWALVLKLVANRLLELEKRRKPTYSLVYLATTSTTCVVLFYFLISSYAFGIYPFMPSSRGGKLPLSAVVFDMSPRLVTSYPELVAVNATPDPHGAKRSRPVYILDQNDDEIVVVSEFRPFTEIHVGPPYTLPRSEFVPRRSIGVDLRASLVSTRN